MRTLFTFLLILLSKLSWSQEVIRLEVFYERIPINHKASKIDVRTRVLIVSENRHIGIISEYDTLDLYVVSADKDKLYCVDLYHTDKQTYCFDKYVGKLNFIFIIAPMKPYSTRPVNSIIIESL